MRSVKIRQTDLFRSYLLFAAIFWDQYLAQLLMTHPILSIWFHHPAEFYDAYQRLCVAFGSVFTILAVNAMFFGQGQPSVEQDLSIAIYSALITAPVGVCFPLMFKRAAAKAASQRDEADALSDRKTQRPVHAGGGLWRAVGVVCGHDISLPGTTVLYFTASVACWKHPFDRF